MQIKGTFKQFIYRSDKGYVIGLFKVKDTNDNSMNDYLNKTITITGYFHELSENENYIFQGETTTHPKYGFQFNVKEYERIKPKDTDGIIEFLASGLFKGIGEKFATRIVDKLGDKALDLILEDKTVLMDVPKMTTKRADSIYETLIKYEESQKTIVYLTELGFTSKDALTIYNLYKNNTISIIEHNIYKICDDVDNISFSKIDTIALNKNISKLDDNRIEACIYYIMQNLTYKNGDTYLLFDDIKNGVSKYLSFDIDDNTLISLMENLVSNMKIVINNEKYYLYEIYESEYNILDKIKFLLYKKADDYKNIDSLIEQLSSLYNINYNESQIDAIKSSLTNNITIITGGPGVGKTTIIKAIVEIYRRINKLDDDTLDSRIALLAPTGRASKRMSESTGYKATTIHRFLKWNKESNEFTINEYNKDFSHLIIVDEASMIDINLLSNLFQGLTDNIKLILVGDYNQLPSVGPGNVLKDLIESEIIDTIKLDHLYRQSEDSYIPELAKDIKENNLNNFLNKSDDYLFLNCNIDSIIPNLMKLVNQIMDKGYTYLDTQIMAPMYAGYVGIDNLNKTLQDVFNPPSDDKKELKYGDVIYRVDDKVLQLVNMPDLNVFNGDIGRIIDIADSTIKGIKEVVIDFDSNIVRYKVSDLTNIKHGFVISIHKSQGSEFKMVVMLIAHTYNRLLYRKLIYTGVTRAKNKLIIIGEQEAFINGVNNKSEYIRKTNLKNKLLECIKPNN